MPSVPHHAHTLTHWLVLAEHGLLRSLMVAVGVLLIAVGFGLSVTMVMLPAGVALGFTGLGLFLWGAAGDLPDDDQ
ncbi:MAG: hypothetical protein FJW23_12415 [Acidimicrobiia bacterium]|nr:hypothetical protein [Acidimicrobiia bacterium]